MKRSAVILAILSFTVSAAAQTSGQPAQQTPPAAGQTATAAKRPPQAKTQPEFDAYKAGMTITDPTAMEKAADDFATKFPNSELRSLLYQTAMRLYQSANNAEKTEAMGRKLLSFDTDNPEALVIIAEIIAERTGDSDIDKDQRFAEGISMAQKATQNIDTVAVPGAPQEKIDAYKSFLRSSAYSSLGTIEFKKENYPAAQEDFQKSIDAFPEPTVVLRLALALDKQGKYPEALKVANRAVEISKDLPTTLTTATRERDRLQQLTGGAAPAPPQTPPKN
jgi:tetratricopeptide (TPR) repeat protein